MSTFKLQIVITLLALIVNNIYQRGMLMCNLDHILMWSLTVFQECECVSKEQHEGHNRLQALVQCDDSCLFLALS